MVDLSSRPIRLLAFPCKISYKSAKSFYGKINHGACDIAQVLKPQLGPRLFFALPATQSSWTNEIGCIYTLVDSLRSAPTTLFLVI